MSFRNRVLDFALRAHKRRCANTEKILKSGPGENPGAGAPVYKDASRPVEVRVEDLLSRMTLEEKVAQMSMPQTPSGVLMGAALLAQPVGTRPNRRLGIPSLFATGASRGATYCSTSFPVAMARGASWDPELEFRVHGAIGAEAKAIGANVLLAPCINLVRHPGGGRSQETYGEDVHHLTRFAVAAVQGTQKYVMAQPKHYALNNIEEDRFHINAVVDERTLREVYLPHFHAAVTEGEAASVMSAYNKVNGQYCGEHKRLLREILKDEWGFDGFVMSDWVFGTRSTVDAANNGLDMEMPAPRFYGKKLLKAAKSGEVRPEAIDDAVRRLLRKMFEFGLFEKAPEISLEAVNIQEYRDLAREAAQKSMVLLKNDDAVLPLPSGGRLRVAVIGKYANRPRLGDHGSSGVWAQGAVTPYAGIRAAAGEGSTTLYNGSSAKKAARVASEADVAVVVAALSPSDEGEWMDKLLPMGGDRRSLALHKSDIEKIRAVAAACRKTIVVIQSGSTVTMEDWIDEVPAVLMAWYPGVEGGNALTDILFGKVNPSGKLPVSVPRSEGQLPPIGSRQPEVKYSLLHGYRYMDAHGHEPRFPFGFGLGYTKFKISNLELSAASLREGETLKASFEVANVGTRSGAEVAQLYVSCKNSRIERAPRELKGFAKVELQSGERRQVTLNLTGKDLAYWDVTKNGWAVEPAEYEIHVGSSSRDLPLKAVFDWVG